MIAASRVTRWGGNARKACRAGARPCKGTASAIAGGWGHHSGTEEATDQDSPATVPDRSLETKVVATQEALSMVIAELIKDAPTFIPPEPICWGSSDFQLIELDSLWIFKDFIIFRRTHTPSVAPLGQPWVEYRCIALSDVDAIEEFRRHAGLTDSDLEEQ